jgi:hypothetical protein
MGAPSERRRPRREAALGGRRDAEGVSLGRAPYGSSTAQLFYSGGSVGGDKVPRVLLLQ